MSNRLVAKCEGYGDPMAAPWQPRLCAYASAATGVQACVDSLLASAALLPGSEAEAAEAAAALAAARQDESDDAAPFTEASPLRFRPQGLRTVLNVRARRRVPRLERSSP